MVLVWLFLPGYNQDKRPSLALISTVGRQSPEAWARLGLARLNSQCEPGLWGYRSIDLLVPASFGA